MHTATPGVLAQIDQIISQYSEIDRKYPTLGDADTAEVAEFITSAVSLIDRIAGLNSVYGAEVRAAIATYGTFYKYMILPHVVGVLRSLRSAVASGYLATLQELVHADVFSDFLDMAEYLLGEGYKDPAAVLIGGVLEEHLHNLCLKTNISVVITDAKGNQHPKKADAMNSELAKSGVYGNPDQKNVTAWLDLRNKAAHGRYTEYTKGQIDPMLLGVREFTVRIPA